MILASLILFGAALAILLAGSLWSDLVQTASNVLVAGTNSVLPATAGAVITAGQPLYQGTNGQWLPGVASSQLTSGGNTSVRIALSSAPGTQQPITTLISGIVNLGATLTPGQIYCISNTTGGGKIAPYSDLVTGNWVTILGVALDANNLQTPSGGPFASNTHL